MMLAEPDSTDTLTLKSIVRDDDLTDDDWRNLEPGPIFPPIMTDQMLEKLEEKGINPDEIIYEGLSDEGSWLVGEEAWNKFMKDREIDFGPVYTDNPIEIELPEEECILLSTPTPAQAEFTVIDLPNSPASGSISVHYEGIQVTTQYSSGCYPLGVAMTIRNNINNHPDIQLTAGGPVGPTIILTEKRAGCGPNGNTVYITSSTGTHICVSHSSISMSGGTDDGVGCDPLDPPDTPVLKSPPDGSRGHPVNNLKLEWNHAQGAASYRLQVANNPSFNPIARDLSGLHSNFAILNYLPKNTTFYWRIRASNSGGDSDWSNIWSFKTKTWINHASYVVIPSPPMYWGQVQMFSISSAMEPIDYIGVIGSSWRRIGWVWHFLGQVGDGGENRSTAIAGITEFKWPDDPVSTWQQEGDHRFDEGLYIRFGTSWDSDNF